MNLLIGVTGGIAAYKACDLVSRSVRRGWSVRVAMTRSATSFVGPLTFQALSGHPVAVDALALDPDPDGASAIEHINLARWADVACVAPLTANTLAKLAMGLTDDALTTTLLALEPEVPVLLCPAMNTQMWLHPVTQRNLRWITDLGRYTIVAPTDKRLACGEVGVGGLAEVDQIVAAIEAAT